MPVAASKSTANVVAARKLRVGRAVVPRPPDCGGRGHRFLQAGPCVPAMYLGFLWILLGWGIFFSNAPAFLVLPGFVLSMNRFQIEPEERALTRLFGQAFVAYATRVRRWR